QGLATNSLNFLMAEEFIWFNSAHPATAPTVKTHYAEPTGTVIMRAGWPNGGADGSSNVTHMIFQCGDHFAYHQHYDQNSFTLFKGGDLLVDSGVYSENGLSFHDRDYYVRTIAHNTLIVYNPTEDFSSSRPGASLNDGGQRSFTPASRSPTSLDYFQKHITSYDTGDILHFDDQPGYTYISGDATKAYNNPSYNQAMNTPLSGNTAKVSRFIREFVYLRDPAGVSPNEKVVLLDRVGVTSSQFSGSNTKLLFHTLNEPVVFGQGEILSPGETLYPNANIATASSANGRLTMQFLYPLTRNVRKVGGRGEKAFWVFGTNVDWHWNATENQPRPTSTFDPLPYGEWRLELEPTDNQLDHLFLTVLHPSLQSDAPTQPAQLIHGSGLVGAFIPCTTTNRIVLFSAAHDGAPPVGPVNFSVPSAEQVSILMFDLPPDAKYHLQVTQNLITLIPHPAGSHTVNSQGVLAFSVTPEPFLTLGAIQINSEGDFEFTVQGPNGATVLIEETETLSGWTQIGSGTLTNGQFHFTAPVLTGEGTKFFRARFP
ncbi:MAG: heparinase II/III family protein, partial [Limisphaerales bacterium]